MKIKKSIIHIFLSNYLIFFISLILAIFIFGISFIYQIGLNFNDVDTNETIFKEHYNDLDKEVILKNEGWIEVVKDNKIINVIGNKKDNIKEYSIESVLNNEKLKSDFDIKVYDKDKKNHNIIYIVKIPKEENKEQNQVKFKKLNRFTVNSLMVSIIFIILIIVIMATTSINAITKPLNKIKIALKEMTEGNTKVRLKFKSYKEIEQIRDSFNYMADELERVNKEKILAEESKKKIIRDISHDIKTPITSIMGYSKALSEDRVEDNEERKIYLGYIYNKTRKIDYLVNELFTFAKLDSINYVLNKKEEDFCEFLRETILFYYGDIEEKNFQLGLDIPEKVIKLNFDSKEMERAIGNLILNSLKYNKEGTKLDIFLKELQDKVVLHIRDNGIGIKKELVSTVFQEFVKVDESRNSKEGSGLGLAITKKIVELHNGKINLITEEGVGTEFKIILNK